jgi:Sigma-70 region 2
VPAGTAVPAAPYSCVSATWQAREAELLSNLQHRLADAETANDVLQDVLVTAMRHGQGFCTLDNPRAWLFQVVRNRLIDRARASHPSEPLPDGDDAPAALLDDPPPPVDALATCNLAGQTVRDFAETTTSGCRLPSRGSYSHEVQFEALDRGVGLDRAGALPGPGIAGPVSFTLRVNKARWAN